MKKIILSILTLSFALMVAAQNVNPTVVVTNDYSSSFSSVQKNTIQMAIPDSLLQFDRNFSYSTSDNPFKGSYEFVPFSVQLSPERGDYGKRTFWACAGAGYAMRPVLNAVFSPEIAKAPGLNLDIYQKGGGYWGEYFGQASKSYDFSERFGVDMKYMFSKVALKARVGYDGFFRNPQADAGNFNSVFAGVELASDNTKAKYLFYNLSLDYRHGASGGVVTQWENDWCLRGSVAPRLAKSFSVPVDLYARMNSVQGASLYKVAPHIQLSLGPVDLRGGASIEFATPAKGEKTRFCVYPDVTASIDIWRKYLNLFAGVTGGNKYYSFYDMLERDHFNTTVSGMSETSLDFYAGFKGGAGNSFNWKLMAGYMICPTMIMNAIIDDKPGFVFDGVKILYADLRLGYRGESLEADGGVHFCSPKLTGPSPLSYASAPLKGDARIRYNYCHRIYAGVYVEASMARKSMGYDPIPGYVDLGANFEYRYNRHLSFWLQGANLLSNPIYRTPIYAQKGVAVTGGICLNF